MNNLYTAFRRMRVFLFVYLFVGCLVVCLFFYFFIPSLKIVTCYYHYNVLIFCLVLLFEEFMIIQFFQIHGSLLQSYHFLREQFLSLYNISIYNSLLMLSINTIKSILLKLLDCQVFVFSFFFVAQMT